MSIMLFISQQLALFVLRIIENTKQKCDFNISNLTNSGLFKTRNIDVANTEMHHKSKKALVNQGLSATFNGETFHLTVK